MHELSYTTSSTPQELAGILELQKANLRTNLSGEEITSQGFVTVVHTLNDLTSMNALEQHTIAKDGEQVVAYLLAMTRECRQLVPVLVPMFKMFDETAYNGHLVSQLNYIVVGQVCVGKPYRGQGVLDRCYEEYRSRFQVRYDCAVTEIDVTNTRSLNAHRRIGFSEIRRYTAPGGAAWSIVLWDWKQSRS